MFEKIFLFRLFLRQKDKKKSHKATVNSKDSPYGRKKTAIFWIQPFLISFEVRDMNSRPLRVCKRFKING